MPIAAPPAAIWQPLEAVAPGIYRAFVGRVFAGLLGRPVVVTSWYRSIRENRDVGGDPASQHLLGFALDFETAESSAIVQSLRRVGLIALDEGDHVHLQLFPRAAVAPLVALLAR